MDERGANIDLVFRNGLKDFEVLPPPEVWASIKPAIKIKPKPFNYFKAAAMIAAVLTISYLAYEWSSEISTVTNKRALAFEIDSFSPLTYPIFDKAVIASGGNAYVPVEKKDNESVSTPRESFTTSVSDDASIPVSENSLVAQNLILSPTDNLSLGGTFTSNNNVGLSDMNTSKKKSVEVKPVVPQYIPESAQVKPAERWSIGAMASPTYYSSFSSGSNELTKQMASSEQSLISYSGGISLSYSLNKRFSVQTGLYYSSLGQEIDGIKSFGGFQRYDYTKGDHNFAVLTTSGTVYTSNADVFLTSTGPGERILTAYTNDVFDPDKANLEYINNTLIQNFSYLELPVVLRYKIIDKAIDINLLGGISYNMMIDNSVYTMVDGGKYPIGKTEGLNLLNVSSSLGMGMEYSFSKKLSLNLEPTFRYYLNPFNEYTGSNTHPYSFGVFSGISYKF
jgi:hypothetical protein